MRDFYEILCLSLTSGHFRALIGGSMLAGSGIIEANRRIVEPKKQRINE
jgi:hypothetical protein